MNINPRDLNKLNSKGVYAIVNTKNNKVYIGSTSKSFSKRFKEHYDRLNNKTHENSYLQRSWNKYQKYFVFRILLETEDSLFWEQRAFNLYKPFNKRGYNLNKLAHCPPQNLSKNVIKKRSETFTKTLNDAMHYYYKVKDKIINISEVPEKYKILVNSYINKSIWNKGKKGYVNKNYPKNRITSNKGTIKRKKAFVNLCKTIYVYKNNIFINKYLNIHDLLNDVFLLNEVSLYRSKKGNILKKPNIYNSCRTKKSYKGLNFYFEPLL
jgi:group I intron endonuclease